MAEAADRALSGSGIVATVNIGPGGGTNLARFTPGAANNVRAGLPPFPSLWLNEVLPDNFFLGTNGVADRFGERDPWLELYNSGTNAIDLGAYYLANNYTNLTQWRFPASTFISRNSFCSFGSTASQNSLSAASCTPAFESRRTSARWS